MTMSMVGPYLTTTRYNRKQKPSKSKKLQKAQQEHEAWLKSMGVGKSTPKHSNEIPNYRTRETAPLSNKIAGHGAAKERVQYTGNEIAGIVVTHKSNLMPVRKDNKQAAIDAATMRRN